jgi:hypothetical protein
VKTKGEFNMPNKFFPGMAMAPLKVVVAIVVAETLAVVAGDAMTLAGAGAMETRFGQ